MCHRLKCRSSASRHDALTGNILLRVFHFCIRNIPACGRYSHARSMPRTAGPLRPPRPAEVPASGLRRARLPASVGTQALRGRVRGRGPGPGAALGAWKALNSGHRTDQCSLPLRAEACKHAVFKFVLQTRSTSERTKNASVSQRTSGAPCRPPASSARLAPCPGSSTRPRGVPPGPGAFVHGGSKLSVSRS